MQIAATSTTDRVPRIRPDSLYDPMEYDGALRRYGPLSTPAYGIALGLRSEAWTSSTRVRVASIDRMQSRMILLGRSRAIERVCGFLLEMGHRTQVQPDGTFTLPIYRYDIADYLALAVETVSRSLTTLRAAQVITFLGTRQLRIVNRRALEAQCRN